MSKTLYLSGGWGYGNLGDNAILKCTYEQLSRLVPQDKIIVTSYCPKELLRHHNLNSHVSLHRQFSVRTFSKLKNHFSNIPNIIDYNLWRAFDVSLLPALQTHIRLISECDAVVLAGGGYFNSAWSSMMNCQFQIIEIASRLGKPVFICGQTIGPFSAGAPREKLRHALKNVKSAGCRDKGSIDLIQSLSDGESVGVETSDVVNLLPPPARRPIGEKLVVGVMIQLFRGHDNPLGRSPKGRIKSSNEYIESVVSGLATFAHKKNVILKFISSTSWDLENCREVYRRLIHLADVNATPPRDLTIDDFISECQSVDMMISTNMHPVIIAATAGRPSMALSYSFKLNNYMSSVGLDEFVLKIDDFSSETLAETANSLYDRIDQSAAIVQSRMPQLLEKAELNFAAVAKELA